MVHSLLLGSPEDPKNRITMLTLGLATAACSSSANQPTPAEYDDTAQAIASTTSTSNGGSSAGGDVASMADTVSLSLGVMPQGISLMGDGHFHGSRLGVDYNYSLTCKSVAGLKRLQPRARKTPRRVRHAAT